MKATSYLLHLCSNLSQESRLLPQQIHVLFAPVMGAFSRS